jgi:hypothetical protein
MAKNWRRRSKFQNGKFRSYALVIGQMNLAFNDFHEALGDLFMEVMVEANSIENITLQLRALVRSQIIWGHVTNDRQKRLLLEEMAKWLGKERKQKFPSLEEDLQFLARRGHKLEDKRNNVIHAPVYERDYGALQGKIVTATLNYRAKNLARAARRNGGELLHAVRLYRDHATVLAAYARAIRDAWQAKEKGRRKAWPKRPTLPPLKDED